MERCTSSDFTHSTQGSPLPTNYFSLNFRCLRCFCRSLIPPSYFVFLPNRAKCRELGMRRTGEKSMKAEKLRGGRVRLAGVKNFAQCAPPGRERNCWSLGVINAGMILLNQPLSLPSVGRSRAPAILRRGVVLSLCNDHRWSLQSDNTTSARTTWAFFFIEAGSF